MLGSDNDDNSGHESPRDLARRASIAPWSSHTTLTGKKNHLLGHLALASLPCDKSGKGFSYQVDRLVFQSPLPPVA